MEKHPANVTVDDLVEDFKNGVNDKLLGDLLNSDTYVLQRFSLGIYGYGTEASRADAVRNVVNNIIFERLNTELIKVEKSISAAGKGIKWATFAIGITGLLVAVVGLLHTLRLL